MSTAPYGTWKSPITADFIVSDAVGLDMIVASGEDVYWIETRPKEGGRHVIVKRSPDGKMQDMTPPEFYAATRAHEYGGGAYTVKDGTIYFSNYSDQCVYKQEQGRDPVPITPAQAVPGGLRYADMIVDPFRNRLIAVCEDHTRTEKEPVNSIIAVSLDGSCTLTTLASGHDFYSSPKLKADGSRLAWLSWDHPNMPWDGTELSVGEFAEDGSLAKATVIAGGGSESIFQPEWSASGQLLFVSDRTDWWNLYRYDSDRVEPLCPMEAEFGRPQWQFGFRTYAFGSADSIICAFNQGAIWKLAKINLTTKAFTPLPTEYTEISWPTISGNRLIFRGASPTKLFSIVAIDLTNGKSQELKVATTVAIDPEMISSSKIIEFPTTNGLRAYAFYYPPRNKDFHAPPDEKPPLLVKSHGGPTSSLSSALNLEIQFWTSRGFAVVDVNYGGSTSYGRRYRERLYGQWGIVDVDDCTNAALHLADKGMVDPKRMLISGRSASGFTTLCALTFKNVYRAGASYFGISDLAALYLDTHKFESRSSDRLIAPYPARRDIYMERSPVYHTQKISCPIIFFQGLDDKVVPPNQTEAMVEALKKRHLPVACVLFEGEGHGFRKAETIKRALECELYFYSQILGFQPADRIVPVRIENMEALRERSGGAGVPPA
jgi:dipeptidyl aminopeptidase/acylaminoacyl peptidase